MTANSFGSLATLRVGEAEYQIHGLDAVDGAADLPFSLKILLENLLRTEDGRNVTREHITALAQWDPAADPSTEIQFTPARVILQDLTGVPAVVDLATMREAMKDLGGDPGKINPLVPAELVIDHSVVADIFGRPDAFDRNVELEFGRNRERFQFLRWGQDAFSQFKVVPPGTGIVHQVNIEHLARVVMARDGAAYPDTSWAPTPTPRCRTASACSDRKSTRPCSQVRVGAPGQHRAPGPGGDGPRRGRVPGPLVGTDSHTTMQNGLGVL